MRRAVPILVAVAASLALAACSSEPAAPEDLCPNPSEATTIELADFSYAPGCAAVDAGSSLELRNVGDAPHTFTVNDTGIDVNVDAGGTATVELTGIAAGTYEVVCTLHPQMEGALQVA
ncbi:MAG TPA: cupredoxin domain-containing protein [Actinomycetota bacterium]|nr:cupredoxin domain-containing protein [Actinomycetota bacterium]